MSQSSSTRSTLVSDHKSHQYTPQPVISSSLSSSFSSTFSPQSSLQFVPSASFKQQNCFLANIFNLPHECLDEPQAVDQLIREVLGPQNAENQNSESAYSPSPSFHVQLFNSRDEKTSVASVAMSSQATLIALVNGINGLKYKNFTLACSIVPPQYPYAPQVSPYGPVQSTATPFIPFPLGLSPGSAGISNQWPPYPQEGFPNFHLSAYPPSQFFMVPPYNTNIYPGLNNFQATGFFPHPQFGYYTSRRRGQRRHRNSSSSQAYRSHNWDGRGQKMRYHSDSNGSSVDYVDNDSDSASSNSKDRRKQKEQQNVKQFQDSASHGYDSSGGYCYNIPAYTQSPVFTERGNYKSDNHKDYGGNYPNLASVKEPQESNTYVSEENLSTEELMMFDSYKHVDPKRIFIGNVPFTSTFESLREFFQSSKECGEGLKDLVMQHQVNGNFRGFAIGVTESQDDSVALIKEFNGKTFEGRELTVRFDKLPDLILRNRHKKRPELPKESEDESVEGKVTETVEGPAKKDF